MRVRVPANSIKENDNEKGVTQPTLDTTKAKSALQNVFQAFSSTQSTTSVQPNQERFIQLQRNNLPPSANTTNKNTFSNSNLAKSLHNINDPQNGSENLYSGFTNTHTSSVFPKQRSTSQGLSKLFHIPKFTPSISLSEKSAFTHVSPSKIGNGRKIPASLVPPHMVTPCPLRLKPRIALAPTFSQTQTVSLNSYISSVAGVSFHTTSCTSNVISTNEQVYTDVVFNTLSKSSVVVTTPSSVQSKTCVENNILIQPRYTHDIKHLPDISDTQNSFITTTIIHYPTQNVFSSQPSLETPTSQTFLLAVPNTVNVNQFSNQTLNLDYSSQQLLKALLQNSKNGSNIDTSVVVPDMKGRTYASMLEDSNEEEKDKTDLDKTGDFETMDTTEISTVPPPFPDLSSNVRVSESNATELLSKCRDEPNKQNSPVVTQEGVQFDMNPLSNVNLNVTSSNEERISDTTLANTHQQQQQLPGNPLPVAAINVNMISGQPVYTIQIMGQSIPLAAITIPTADGPLELQSATTSLTTSELLLPSHDPQNNLLTQQRPFTDKETRSNSTCSEVAETGQLQEAPDIATDNKQSEVQKPKYTCEICGKTYIRSWSYYGHLREHAGTSKVHKCYICSKVLTSVAGLKQHLQIHVGQKDFLCTLCNKTFASTNALRTHQISHIDEKTFQCKSAGCTKSFSNSTSLRTHQRVHQEEKPFACMHDGCGKSFKTPSELSRHEFRHTGEKPYKCDQCEKSFVRNDDLKRHYFIHTGQKRFKCDQCDFSCIQSFDLVKHKYIHGGEKPYKCDLCPKQFTRPARLRDHQRLHTGERPYLCEHCGKSFTQLTSLKAHKLTHSTEKPYQCGQCEKAFSTATDLRSHAISHLGVKPFQCNICEKEFVSSKTLNRHAIVHTGEKPFECPTCHKRFARSSDLKVHLPVHEEEKPFKCDQCGKTFTRYNTLKDHHRLHTGMFPFKCTYCEKKFNHRSHLNVHLRTHTGERPHKCGVCSKDFTRQSSLRNHLRSHHAGVDVIVDEDDESNYSDTSLVEGQQIMQLDQSNIQLLKSIQNALKRKRCEGEDDDDDTDMVAHKRQLTSYPEHMLSNLVRTRRNELQTNETVTVVNSSDLVNPVLLTHLPSGQYAHLPQTQVMAPDGRTVVALNLSDIQPGDLSGSDNIQLQGLESLLTPSQESQSLSQQGTLHHLDHSILTNDNQTESLPYI